MGSFVTNVRIWWGALIGPSPRKGFVGIPQLRRSIQIDWYSCAAHAVQTVLQHHGDVVSIERLKQEMGTTTDGTLVSSVVRCLRRYGRHVGVRRRMQLADMAVALARGRLVIAETDGAHVLVVHGMDGDYVYVADSSALYAPLQRLPRALFRKRWDRAGLIVY